MSATVECEVSVLAGLHSLANEPGAGHAEVREEMGAVVEHEVEHFAFAADFSEGAAFDIEVGVEDVLRELGSR
jgi:hypothetical protein